MSVYSNRQIRQAVKSGHIVFHPFKDENIAGSSIDVTLGEWFIRTQGDKGSGYYNPFDPESVSDYFAKPQKAVIHQDWAREHHRKLFKGIPADHPIIVLKPGERILAHTHEFIGIKPPGTSTMQARSSWGRNGVAVCLDAGWGDPGYINRWTMEVYNMNQHSTIALPVGERIAQMVFYETGQVDGEYNTLSGKYQTKPEAKLDEIIASWKPEDMLPRSYKDQRIMPIDPGTSASSVQPAKDDAAVQVAEVLSKKYPEVTSAAPSDENDVLTSESLISIEADKISSLLSSQLINHPAIHRLQPQSSRLQPKIKDNKGYYYHTPPALNADEARLFEQTIDAIYNLRHEMADKLEASIQSSKQGSRSDRRKQRQAVQAALENILPIASAADYQLVFEPEQIPDFIKSLKDSSLMEANERAGFLQSELKKQYGDLVLSTSSNDTPSKFKEKLAKIAESQLAQNLSPETEVATLVDYSPRSEYELIPILLFSYTDQPQSSVEKQINDWSYKDKTSIIENYIKHLKADESSSADISYTLELTLSYAEIEALLAYTSSVPALQEFTPRYGYSVPEIIDKAGLSDKFERCFDLSYKLYSALQASENQAVAQYAVLRGNKVRCRVNLNLKECLSIISDAQLSKQTKQAISEQIRSIHPIIGKSL